MVFDKILYFSVVLKSTGSVLFRLRDILMSEEKCFFRTVGPGSSYCIDLSVKYNKYNFSYLYQIKKTSWQGNIKVANPRPNS